MYKSLIGCQNIISRLAESLIEDSNAKVELLEIFPDKHSLPHQKMVSFAHGVTKWYLIEQNLSN